MEFLVRLLLSSLSALLLAYILPGVTLSHFGYAVALAAVLALLNVSLRPILIFLTLPATIISMGLFLLVINACIILVADWLLMGGFSVRNFWWALLFSMLLSILNSVFTRLAFKQPIKSANVDVQIFDKDGNRVK